MGRSAGSLKSSALREARLSRVKPEGRSPRPIRMLSGLAGHATPPEVAATPLHPTPNSARTSIHAARSRIFSPPPGTGILISSGARHKDKHRTTGGQEARESQSAAAYRPGTPAICLNSP